MKCPKCDFNNLSDSIYCQDCGHDLSIKETGLSENVKKIHEEIEDVIFQPSKKKRGFLFYFVLITVILIILLIGYAIYDEAVNNPTSVSDSTPQDTIQEAGAINYLKIENDNLDWIGEDIYYMGTIKNVSAKPINNIRVRIDFYWDKATTQVFDTRYAVIEAVAANGAFSFKNYIPIYPSKEFWWLKQIESASY